MMNVKEARRTSGMTSAEVAKQCDISYPHYNFIENGKRRPSVEVAKRIAAVLGFEWTKFFEDERDGKQNEEEKQKNTA